MTKLRWLVLFYTALLVLGGCSTESGITLDNPVANQGPGLVAEDDQDNQLTAGNYHAVVTTSMNLLRAGYFPETVTLLEQLAELWGSMRDAMVGSENFNCPQGGVVTRTVTQAPDLPETGLPEFSTKSALVFDACSLDGNALSGEVQWDWNESSPTQLSATSYHNHYRFNELVITSTDSEKRLNGSYDRRVTVAGPGDSYTNNSITDSFVQNSNGKTTTVSNGNYSQRFSHFVAQSEQPNGILHSFSETGSAQLKIDELRLVGATISVDPELVYANEETAGSVSHTTRLTSGKLTIALPNKATLTMENDSNSQDSVIYSIISNDQQEVVIEREWIAPAECQSDERFNYGSC